MRDDSTKWSLPFTNGDRLVGEHLDLTRIVVPRQTLVSGTNLADKIDAAIYPRVGWPDPAPAGACALVMRRDRLLLLGGDGWTPGWDDQRGFAVTDLTSGLEVFDVVGKMAAFFLQRLGELSVDLPSPSVMRRLHGVDVALYRAETPDCFRLHVPRAQAPSFWSLLESLLNNLNSSR
ncbi:MAG: hypothetical protein AAF636_09220 [Pseudomonadota bacterium]